MAFPTSSLTNNQVHKEGNRAFVYDSALGVWDQVRETDRSENKIVQGEIGSGVTFPAGHVIGTKMQTDTENLSTTTTTATTTELSLSCTSGNILVAQIVGGYTYSAYNSSNVAGGIRLNYNSTDYDKLTGYASSNNAISSFVGCAFITHSITFTGIHTIKRIVKKVDGSGTARWSADVGSPTIHWIIQEIKPTA